MRERFGTSDGQGRDARNGLVDSWRSAAVLGACVVLASIFWGHSGPSSADAQVAPGSSSTQVAVVDLEQVFDASPQKKLLETQIEADFKEKLATLEGMEADIKKLQNALTMVKPGSPLYDKHQEDIAVKTTRLKASQERFSMELDRRRADSFERIYEEIKGVVRKVAGEMGIDLVLQRRLTIQDNMPSWDSVLFARDGLDITPLVVNAISGK